MADIRKEQLDLLRFEKALAGLAAVLAAAAGSARAADEKLGANLAGDAFVDAQNALMTLAELTSSAHAALDAKAFEVGARVLQASGGIPKTEPGGRVASILGLG